MKAFTALLPSQGRVCLRWGVVKATARTGSSVHILLIPDRHLPYGPQQALGKDSESHGRKRSELQNAQSWEQAGQGAADDQLQNLVPTCLLAGFSSCSQVSVVCPSKGTSLLQKAISVCNMSSNNPCLTWFCQLVAIANVSSPLKARQDILLHDHLCPLFPPKTTAQLQAAQHPLACSLYPGGVLSFILSLPPSPRHPAQYALEVERKTH